MYTMTICWHFRNVPCCTRLTLSAFAHDDDGWRCPMARVLTLCTSYFSFKHPPGTITVEMRKPINERLDYRNEPHSDREVWGQGRGPPPRSINDRIWGWDREDQGRASHESLPLRESVSFGYFEDRHREPYPSPSLNSLQSRENGRDRGRMLDLRHTIGRQDSSRDREWERERTGDNGWGQEPDNPAPFDRDLRRTIEDRRQREPPVAARGPDETARRDGVCERRGPGCTTFEQAQDTKTKHGYCSCRRALTVERVQDFRWLAGYSEYHQVHCRLVVRDLAKMF